MKSALSFIVILLLVGCSSIDPNTDYDHIQKILEYTDTNSFIYLKTLGDNFNDFDNFGKADYYLIVARLTSNKEIVCKSIPYYKKYQPKDQREKALILETIASLDCGENSKNLYQEASIIWKQLDNNFRANIDLSLAKNQPLNLQFEIPKIKPSTLPKEFSQVTIGKSSMNILKDEKLLIQTERVTRDWLSAQLASPSSKTILKVFSEQHTLPEKELREDIGWHEGARLLDMHHNNFATTTSTLAAKHQGKWYAPNENGIFMFEIPLDKILYPTTRFLRDDLALIVDVHGVNMMVSQAINNNADIVMGCCDFPGKVHAAEYLAKRGKKILCFTDRFVPLLTGKDLSIIPSAPITLNKDSVTIGNRPIIINKEEIIIATHTTKAQQYYDTPARYFSFFPELNVINYTLQNNSDTINVVKTAENNKAKIIAGRVYSIDDYNAYKPWLEKDNTHRLILFHSMPYPYGKLIFEEFPTQTTFGDINPIFTFS